MLQAAEITDDARQRRSNDVLIKCGKDKRQHQSGEHEPEVLAVTASPRQRLRSDCRHGEILGQGKATTPSGTVKQDDSVKCAQGKAWVRPCATGLRRRGGMPSRRSRGAGAMV